MPLPAARRVRVTPVLLAAAMLLAACAAPVTLPPGEAAADPVCARVLMATPDELGGLERRSTTAQATTAWGEPAVTLRCGVTPPGPTTDRCLSVAAGTGDNADAADDAVDWINPEGDSPAVPERAAASGSWTFLTYGRSPAVEVVVPVEQAGDQPTAFLLELASAVELVPAERHCVGATDVG